MAEAGPHCVVRFALKKTRKKVLKKSRIVSSRYHNAFSFILPLNEFSALGVLKVGLVRVVWFEELEELGFHAGRGHLLSN